MKEKILVVDDEYANRFLLENILSEYDVIAAAGGKEMLDILQNEHPSLILLDVMMPGDDGFQIAKKLSIDDKFKDIPIIFLTARYKGEDVEEGLGSGAADYIKKPFDEVELKARIKTVIQAKKTELELRNQAITDSLTNIYNRRYFFNRAHEEIAYFKRKKKDFCIAIADIDFFKNINDTFGHQAGDFILKKTSDIFKSYVRPYDLLARYGGEEFIFMFSECKKGNAHSILKRAKNRISGAVFNFKDIKIKFTFSCGISDSNDIDSKKAELEELIRIADERLYKAKKAGRDRIIID